MTNALLENIFGARNRIVSAGVRRGYLLYDIFSVFPWTHSPFLRTAVAAAEKNAGGLEYSEAIVVRNLASFPATCSILGLSVREVQVPQTTNTAEVLGPELCPSFGVEWQYSADSISMAGYTLSMSGSAPDTRAIAAGVPLVSGKVYRVDVTVSSYVSGIPVIELYSPGGSCLVILNTNIVGIPQVVDKPITDVSSGFLYKAVMSARYADQNTQLPPSIPEPPSYAVPFVGSISTYLGSDTYDIASSYYSLSVSAPSSSPTSGNGFSLSLTTGYIPATPVDSSVYLVYEDPRVYLIRNVASGGGLELLVSRNGSAGATLPVDLSYFLARIRQANRIVTYSAVVDDDTNVVVSYSISVSQPSFMDIFSPANEVYNYYANYLPQPTNAPVANSGANTTEYTDSYIAVRLDFVVSTLCNISGVY